MRFHLTPRWATLVISLLLPVPIPAANADASIRNALAKQVAAWNRGDVPQFVDTYAEDCTFVSKQILQGRAQLLARYQRVYPTKDAMGKLTFHNLNVRLLTPQAAVVTGEWGLERSAAGGGATGGVFSLVWLLKGDKWQIILDHTN
jgi:uncharacterized protein (TIGR02246 family)